MVRHLRHCFVRSILNTLYVQSGWLYNWWMALVKYRGLTIGLRYILSSDETNAGEEAFFAVCNLQPNDLAVVRYLGEDPLAVFSELKALLG